jgi:hypothetical protein
MAAKTPTAGEEPFLSARIASHRNMLWKPPESVAESLQKQAPKKPKAKSKEAVEIVHTVEVEKNVAGLLSEQIRRGGKDEHGNDRSFADLLSDMYDIGGDLVADLKARADPTAIKERAEAFKSVARALPMLQAAERNARGLAGDKKAEDMTQAELKQYALKIMQLEQADKDDGK